MTRIRRFAPSPAFVVACVALLVALAGRRRVGAVVAGVLLCTGALMERFAVYHAGKASALDSRYTSVPQRERA